MPVEGWGGDAFGVEFTKHRVPPGLRAPAPPFYSHAVEVTAPERWLYISGQVGQRPDGSAGADIAEQTAIAVENLQRILAGAGMGVEDLVKLTIHLTEAASLGGFAPPAAALLGQPPAAVTLLIVKGLADPRLLIEIEAVAAK
ncbi:MAG: RidA family protein [Caulobacteraceae bacterium]|nr:MAG: RidA family protein [Caulobacteraceae bacterium]